MVAHAGHRDRGLGVGRGAHHVHQARAGPPDRGVETGPVALGAELAVGRERRVYQPAVQRHQVLGAHAQPFARREGDVGDEDVGLPDQRLQDRLRLRTPQVQRQALLVPRVEGPEIVDVVRRAPQPEEIAVGVADHRRLDLDHPGPEIAQHRRRGRPGDEARAINDKQVVEQSRRHPLASQPALRG
jgi:hypothetical protein